MNKNLKILLNCISITIFSFFTVNLIYFLIELNQVDLINNWNFKWKYGSFFLNGNVSGLQIGEAKSNGFLIFIFVTTLIYFFSKKKIKS